MRKFIALFAVAALAIVGCTKPAAEGTDTPAGDGISFTQSEVTLYVGDKVTPELKGLQDGEKVGYESGDKAIATVSIKGVITAKKEGETVVTATSKTDASRKASITVKVEPKPADYVSITGLTVSPATLNVKEGESADLPTATVDPSDATDKDNEITWKSENESIVKIEGGKVKGIAAGTANIVATIKDNKGTEFSGKCAVTVKSSNIPTTGISVAPANLKLNPGGSQKLSVTLTPADHTDNPTISWSTSASGVATVSNDGTVTAVAVGDATITAKISDAIKAECKVNVTEGQLEVKYIKFNGTVFRAELPEAKATPDNASLEAWINISSTSGCQNIMGTENSFLFRIDSGQLDFVVGGKIDSRGEFSNSQEGIDPYHLKATIEANKWYHVVGTYTRKGKACLYVDGVQVGEGVDTEDHGAYLDGMKKNDGNYPCWGLPFRFYIGSGNDKHNYSGSIAYARVWSKALSASEIAALKSQDNVTDANLIAYWKFTEGEGNTIADYSGNSITLTAKKMFTGGASGSEPTLEDADITWEAGTPIDR